MSLPPYGNEPSAKRSDDEIVPDSELAPEDDAIIGRAFRWTLLVITALASAGIAGYFMLRPADIEEQVVNKVVGDVPDRAADPDRIPRVTFTDVTAAAGIDFVHVSGAEGGKLLPETMGSGAAFFDYDNDGDQDLLLVNATWWPGSRRSGPKPTMALYANDGRGEFRNVTAASGLDVSLYGVGVAVGDYDNDGDVDLFITALGRNRLFENDGGRFRDVTTESGVAGDEAAWSTSAGFLDYDNDGDLDLFVCNYVDWSKEIDEKLNFTMNGRDRSYGRPLSYGGTFPYLYRNDGGKRFTDVSSSSGVQVVNPATGKPLAKALALSFADVDRDGFMDVLVANDTVQNFFLHNLGDGTFEELGAEIGVGFDRSGNATGAMGIDVAHYRNDDRIAVGIGNFANEMSSLYVSQDDGLLFSDESMGEGIGGPSRLFLSFGLFFFDYDLDGRLDMFEANGHLENEINQVQASQTYRQPAQLFWNAGADARSCFVEVPRDRVGDLSRPIVGRAATYADIDGDGDLDIVVTQVGDRTLLLRNDQNLGHHWLRVKLVGTSSNRDALGARVEVEAGGVVQRRQVTPTRSYLSQTELPVTFGLGTSEKVDRLRVIWPDGSVQDVGPVQVDTVVELVEGDANAQSR